MKIICSLWVSLSLKLWFMLTVSVVNKAVWRGIELKGCDGLVCQPQPELEDIALSRWEWTTLWQPFSKWQKSIQLYWSVILLSFNGHLQTLLSSLLPSAVTPAPPNLPSRSLLILVGDWLSCNLRWTLMDECKLFFFLSLPVRSGVMKS